MDIQEIENRIKSCDRLIKEYTELKRSLQQQMGQLAYPFNVGDKVVFGSTANVGIFGGIEINYGSIRPVIYKIKKDGSVSKNRYYIFHSDVVELCHT